MRRPEPAPFAEATISDIMAEWVRRLEDPQPRAGDLAQGREEFQRVLTEAQREYRPWRKVKIIARAAGVDARTVWLALKVQRLTSQQRLPLTGAEGRAVTFNMPAAIQEETMMADQQLAGVIGIADGGGLTREENDRFLINSLMEEAIASSQIEGAATTRDVAKAMLREGRPPRDMHERMIANNYTAIQAVRGWKDETLTPERLVELQSLLTEGTLEEEDHVGRLRTDADRVRVVDRRDQEVIHDPPPAGELRERLGRLCEFANARNTDKAPFIHPLVRAVALHFQIGFDHPFCDGNGRTARAIFYWSMLRQGYWMFEFLPISSLIRESPAKYAQAYVDVETDGFDLTYFLLYNASVLRRAREALREHVKNKREEIARAQTKFILHPSFNPRQAALLAELLKRPERSITVEAYRATHGVAYATARADLLELARRKYLAQKRIGRKFIFTAGPRLRPGEKAT